MRSLFDVVPAQDRCRYFLRVGEEIKLDRGFRSKEEARTWLEEQIEKYRLDWRVGFLFRLRPSDCDCEIVKRDGGRIRV